MLRYTPTDLKEQLHQEGRVHQSARTLSPRKVVFSLLGIAAILGWLYVLCMSDLFEVDAFEVRGVTTLDPLEVTRQAFDVLDQRGGWRPWSTRNELFIDRQKFANDLREQLFAEKVTVDKINRNVLRLSVVERSKRFVYHSHKQYMWVDLSGVVTDELTPSEQVSVQARLLGQRAPMSTDPPVIHHDLDQPLAVGYVIDQASQVRDWIKLSSDLLKAGLAYREFEPPIGASSTLLSVTAPEGYQILLDTDAALLPQLNTYEAFKRAQPNTQVSEYVDVRIPGRLYIK